MDTLDHARHYQPDLFSVHGRIGRLRYLAYSCIVMLGIVAVGAVAGLAVGVVGDWLGYLAYPLTLGVFAASIIIGKRRVNDLNVSGWWAITLAIPLVNVIAALWLAIAPGTPGPNNYGPAPAPNTRAVVVFASLYAALFVLGMLAAVALPAYVGLKIMNQGAGSQGVEARF